MKTQKKILLKSLLKELLKEGKDVEPDLHTFKLKKTRTFKPDKYLDIDPMEDDGMSDRTIVCYDIIMDGKKKVGELEYEDYFGFITGQMFGRGLPQLSGYGPHHSSVEKHFNSFLDSKSGKKWLEVSYKKMR